MQNAIKLLALDIYSMKAVIICFDLTDFSWETSIQPWLNLCNEKNEQHVSM
jgi:hypothetical protein